MPVEPIQNLTFVDTFFNWIVDTLRAIQNLDFSGSFGRFLFWFTACAIVLSILFILGGIYATVEAYPELKAIETFQHLITRISGLENAIADRREFYNESANINNVAIEQFPELIIANIFRFGSFDLLRFSENEKKDVDVKQLFS